LTDGRFVTLAYADSPDPRNLGCLDLKYNPIGAAVPRKLRRTSAPASARSASPAR
jgi:hypothetical protein